MAHRGGAKGDRQQENRIETGKAAQRLGAAVEGDVVRLQDGTLVIHHDLTGKKTVGVDRRLAELTWNEVAAWRIPTLETFLDAFGEGEMSLDLKFDGQSTFEVNEQLVDDTIGAIRAKGLTDRVTLASLESYRGAVLIRSKGYEGPTALSKPELYLMYLAPRLYRRLPLRGDVAQIPFETARNLGREFFRRCQLCSLTTHVWGVDDAEAAKWLFDLGVHVIETDDPETVLKGLPGDA